MSNYCMGLTDKDIKSVINELGLSGSHHNDQYIAAYHIHNKDMVGCDNYLQKLREREEDLSHKKEEEHPKVVKKDDDKFRNECDTILCDMENGDLSKLGDLTKKQCDTIKNLIFYGLAGAEPYYDSMDELKELAPESFKIYQLIDKVTPTRKRKVDKKKVVAKKIQKLGLGTEVGTIKPNVDSKVLFEDKFSTFVFYNKKNSTITICYCSSDPEERFRGAKTLLGSMTRYKMNSKFIGKIMTLRSVKAVVEAIPVRKGVEVEAMQLNSDSVLLKAFK